MPISIETIDHVRVIRWDDGGDNRCNAASMTGWHEALDELETVSGPLAIVATGATKYFSNGLDLDRFGDHPDEMVETITGLQRLFGRLLLFPAFTVCALNGHAFAGGAMITCAFDTRVMRSDRGYWCLPEVDLGLPMSEAMTATVAAHMPRPALIEAMLTGARYPAEEALAKGIVEHIAPEEEVLARSVQLAAEIAVKDRTVLAIHKKRLFAEAAAICGITEQPAVL